MLTSSRWCLTHKAQTQYNRARGSAHQRGYGKTWQKLRRRILFRDPICCHCKRAASVEVDHIIPKSRGGTDNPDNLQGLCTPCHSRKTVTEDGGFNAQGGKGD